MALEMIDKMDNEMTTLEEMGDLRANMTILEQELLKNHGIDPNLYIEYDVKRGLRDSSGKGVLTGLTEISDVCAYQLVHGRNIPAEGNLYYQGVNVTDIVNGLGDRRFGFEETSYLLLFGKLPSKEEMDVFFPVMAEMEELSNRFVRDVVMKASSQNIMNAMQRCVLTLYTYDRNPEDISAILAATMSLVGFCSLV